MIFGGLYCPIGEPDFALIIEYLRNAPGFTYSTFTTSDENNDYLIKPYFVLNAGLSATVAKKYTLGLRVNNITDEIYETIAYYPLPKRNYSFYINLNF